MMITLQMSDLEKYGGTQSGAPEGVDWDIYGFRTPACNKVLKAAAEACRDNGLVMDFSLGAQSGQGAPAEIDNRVFSSSPSS